jgi:hypothetical protein
MRRYEEEEVTRDCGVGLNASLLPRVGRELLLRESGLIERAIEADVDRRRPLLVRICIVGAGVSDSRGSRRYSLPSTGSA